MRIDLWTPRLTVDDMNDFVYQTLLSLADTYRRATGNDDLMARSRASPARSPSARPAQEQGPQGG
jgi:hypothetical protein